MAEASDAQGILRQNLVDAGCSPEMIRQCAALAQREKTSELLRILSLHRKMLLDTVHQNEKQIDCLDYLMYKLEKHNQ